MASCTLLTSEEDILALAPAWRDLHHRLGLGPFTNFDFAMIWWQTIPKAEKAKFLVAVCYQDDRLVGLIPFSIRTKHKVRVLRLLANEVYYYRNFLLEDPQYAPLLWQAVLASPDYDFAMIKNIQDNSPEDTFLKSCAKRLCPSFIYYWPLAGKGIEDIYAEHSPSFRRKFKKIQKAINQTQGIHYHHAQHQVPDEVIHFMVDRKKQWATEKGKRGIFDEDSVEDFYRALIKHADSENKLYVNWLLQDDTVVGATLSFMEKGVMYLHTQAYAASVAHLTPGLHLCLQAIIWSVQQNFVEMNFMEGEEGYKQRFSKTRCVVYEYVFSRTVLGRLYHVLYSAIRSLRCYSQKTGSLTKN